MGQRYPSAQQSIDFLNEAMKSPLYSASAKIAKQSVVDRGVDMEPPRRLCISELATTLDLENTSNDASPHQPLQDFVHRVNTCAMTRSQGLPRPDTERTRIPGGHTQKQTPERYQRLSSVPNNPSLNFTPARMSEQCKACKRWGHWSNSCFLMCQVYW